ncbi:glycosyltransferase family 2 protein [Salinicola sp. CR57]|uniref:glycosyltransferase family 2 protein n=1 Tax=Salinicola sp. CR57 TaxID=1949086 RepID=UPI0013009032|nr:glycosyltransferase family 2 protein [Salinicola sp. CR57]
MTSSWSIVSTVKAHSALIASFVSYHFSVGADFIYLYLDDADENQYDFFSSIPKVHVYRCDRDYWERFNGGVRPVDHRIRQVFNANHAIKQCESEWLTHIDVDEFLWLECSNKISDVLAGSSKDICRVRPAENFFTSHPTSLRDLFTSSFHLPFPKYRKGRQERKEIGEWCFSCVSGLQGHTYGKVFVRNNGRFKLNIHMAKPFSSHDEMEVDIKLLHFYSLGYLDWLAKHVRRLHPRRLSGVPRWKRLNLDLFFSALKDRHENALPSLFEQALIYQGEKYEKLKEYAGIIDNKLDIEEKVRFYFGDVEELSFSQDLSVIKSDFVLEDEIYKIAFSCIEDSI